MANCLHLLCKPPNLAVLQRPDALHYRNRLSRFQATPGAAEEGTEDVGTAMDEAEAEEVEADIMADRRTRCV
jgi:hypothetical protein